MVRPTILPGEMRDVQNKKARVSTSLLETDGLNQAQGSRNSASEHVSW